MAAVHPGIVPTELGRYNALAQLGSYDAGIPLLQLLLRRQYLKTVGQGAATTLCAMLHELPTTAQPGDRATDALYWADCEPVSPDDAAAGRCGPSHCLRRSLPSHSSLRGGAHLVLGCSRGWCWTRARRRRCGRAARRWCGRLLMARVTVGRAMTGRTRSSSWALRRSSNFMDGSLIRPPVHTVCGRVFCRVCRVSACFACPRLDDSAAPVRWASVSLSLLSL